MLQKDNQQFSLEQGDIQFVNFAVMKLEYDSDDFPVAARKAMASGDVFMFEMRGTAWEKLRSHVVNEQVPIWALLSAIPELRNFVGVMALAGVSDRRVRLRSFVEFAKVYVGTMH